MSDFVISPLAAEDLNQIWENTAEFGGQTSADFALRELVTVFRRLAELPGKGHLRQDLTRLPLHFYFDDPYRLDSSPLAIHAVLHASRNVAALLEKRPLA